MSNIQAIILPTVGLDVGFFGTKFSWGRTRNGAEICVDQFPSDAVVAPSTLWHSEQGRLRGFRVEIHSVHYFVGQDVERLLPTHGARAVRKNYSASTEYLALLRGGLASVATRHHTTRLKIRHLVLGLPMNSFHRDRQQLQMIAAGIHRIQGVTDDAPEIVIEVQQVRVIPQPMGALLACGVKYPNASQETALVCDMGGGTFDWFLAEHLVPEVMRCGATPIGVLQCARDVSARILGRGDDDQPKLIARIDEALRLGKPTVKVTGDPVALAPYLPIVDANMTRALTDMMKSVQSLDDVESIYLTGGGAPLLARVAAKMFPKFAEKIYLDQDPIFSNVKGFHILGEQLHAAGR